MSKTKVDNILSMFDGHNGSTSLNEETIKNWLSGDLNFTDEIA